MWRVEVFDKSSDETWNVMVFDFAELTNLMKFIGENPDKLELVSAQQDFVCIGLDSFKECLE